MKTKLIASISVAALGISTLCGCSFFNKKTQLITISSQPEDARIIINGTNYNNFSPQVIEVDNGEELFITLYREGYKTKYYAVSYHLSDTGKIDAWSSLLIFPIFGLCSDGAWELDENNFSFMLEPLPPQPTANTLDNAEKTPLPGSSSAVPAPAVNKTAAPDDTIPATPVAAVNKGKEEIDGDAIQANAAAPGVTTPASSSAKPNTGSMPGENLPPGSIDLKMPANTPEGQSIITSQQEKSTK